MELNNPLKIEIAQKTIKEVVEPLFWKLEDCLYDGENDLATAIHLDFVYMAQYNPDVLRSGLKPKFLKRLKEITMDIYGGTYKKEIKGITILKSIPESTLPFKKESELRDYLANNFSIIQDHLGSDVKFYGTEVPLEEGFKCDIVAENKTKKFIIELKVESTDHGVVSQVDKYLFYMYRRLRYGLYRELQGVVIAPGFDQFSLNELRKSDIQCFNVAYSNQKESIYLTPIN